MRKYFNLAAHYTPTLHRCVAERLWIHTNQRWHGPYDWAMEFGVSFFGFDWTPTLADPYALITQAKAGQLTEKQSESLEKFKARVDAYYISGKDELLLKSIETGLWHYPK